jgi:L-ascorbate metabolism protein UlaG (beta-lactamase superfamily)
MFVASRSGVLHRCIARGVANILYVYSLEELRVARLGNLGTLLDEAQRTALDDVDVLLIPVGGKYTIDAKQAAAIIETLPSVKLVVPMHDKTEAIADWPIATVEEFESLMDNVRRVGASTVEVKREALPKELEV